MTNEPSAARRTGGPVAGPRAISLDEAAEIATEVRELIEAREEHSAWERLRQLHPADMGIIVVGLPRVSRDTMLRVMSPETVAWMLRQMNPIEAGRVGTRLGARVLTPVLGQLHPQHAPPAADAHRARACRDAPAPIRGGDRAARAPAGYGGLACGRSLPVGGDRRWRSAVAIDGGAESARASLRALDEDRRLFTLVFVVDGAHLAGQIAMVDLALAEPDTSVRALTTQVVATVTVDTPAVECARLQRTTTSRSSRLSMTKDASSAWFRQRRC